MDLSAIVHLDLQVNIIIVVIFIIVVILLLLFAIADHSCI